MTPILCACKTLLSSAADGAVPLTRSNIIPLLPYLFKVKEENKQRPHGSEPPCGADRTAFWMDNPTGQNWLLLEHQLKSTVFAVRITTPA